MITIRSTSDQPFNGIKTLVYGKSGSGKTPLLVTMPDGIILSAEKGLLSVRRTRYPYIEINSMADLVEVMAWTYQSHEARLFAGMSLDSASEVGEIVLTDAIRRVGKDPRKAYGELFIEMVKIAKYFRDIPGKNTVLIAKEEFEKEEQTGLTLYQPQFPGQKLGPALPYYFDETFRMTEVNGYKTLCTKASYQHVARDRSGMLGEYEPPDLTKVFKKILGLQ